MDDKIKEDQKMDEEFKDIEKPDYKNKFIVVGILYFFVIIFSVLFVIGLKNQKDTLIKENNKDKVESTQNKDKKETLKDKKDNLQKEIEKNVDNDYNDELNILNNMG